MEGKKIARPATNRTGQSDFNFWHKDMPFADRLQMPVTLFNGVSAAPTGYTTLGELFNSFTGSDADRAKCLTLRSLAFEVKGTDREKEYKAAKEKSPGFAVGALDHREDDVKHFIRYVPLLVFDFDFNRNYSGDAPPFSDEARNDLFKKVCADPYTFAAFPSPGGGLRVMVWADCTHDEHRGIYASITAYYSDISGLPVLKCTVKGGGKRTYNAPFGIDPTCHNESRHFFYTAGLSPDEFYRNIESRVFDKKVNEAPQIAPTATNSPKAAKGTNKQKKAPEALTDADAWEALEQMVHERNFSIAGRNDYILDLAQLAHEHGFSEEDICGYCLQYAAPDFPAEEIITTVKSAVKRTSGNKFSRENLTNWTLKKKGQSQDNAAKPAGTSDDTEQVKSSDNPEEKSNYNKMVDYLKKYYDFRLDIVSLNLLMRKKGTTQWEELNENNLLHEMRTKAYKVSDRVLMSLLGSDYVEKFDPFLHYFKTLPEYRTEEGDHIEKLAGFIMLKDENERDFFNWMFKKTLVRVAATATLNLLFNKQCFVFMSSQNDGKSTFVRWLCPPALKRYRVDWMREEVGDKDGRFAIAQNFLINLDELASFGKHNIEQTKALMSLDHVKDRPPYGKRPQNFPRRASFFGSTNKSEFLTDETGSVRWLVFEIAGFNHDNGGPDGYGANVDINRVWAQAWHLLQSGEVPPEMTKEEIKQSEERNKRFAVITPEMETILLHLESAGEDGEFMTTTAIANYLQNITTIKLSVNGIGSALKRLKWPQKGKRTAKGADPIKGYYVRRISPGEGLEDQ